MMKREPFSLDLDMQPEEKTEDLQAFQEDQNANKETILDIAEQSDLQETRNTETETQEYIPFDPKTDSQEVRPDDLKDLRKFHRDLLMINQGALVFAL